MRWLLTIFWRVLSRRRATRPPTRRREARCSGGRRSEQRGEREANPPRRGDAWSPRPKPFEVSTANGGSDMRCVLNDWILGKNPVQCFVDVAEDSYPLFTIQFTMDLKHSGEAKL